MNVAMWGKALRVIPRVTRSEWDELDIVSRWLIATRSAVFVITLISCGIAGLLAAKDGRFQTAPFLAMTLGLVLAHATNNLLNDMTDHWKGVDKDNYFRSQYGPQPLEHGLLSIRQMWLYVAVTGIAAIAAGAWLVSLRGPLALELMLVGAFFVLFYTWPLKYIGLGELAVLAVWGPLMVGGGYFVTTGVWSWPAALISLPYALGATTVLFGKHIDKFDADKAKGIRTLPVLLGESAARKSVVVMTGLMYLVIIGLVVTRIFSPALLVVLFAVPAYRHVIQVFGKPRPSGPPPELPSGVWPLWFVAFAFQHNRRFGGLFVLGLLGDVLLHRAGMFM